MEQIEWRDTGMRADMVLTMIAAICISRAGGRITWDQAEWAELSKLFGNRGAILFQREGDSFIASFGTPESVAQSILADGGSVQ